ncbi:JmjC domain-containing protein [Roseovarius indicus]|uniref:Cupin superfamily protein n=1 Tax=Roseovarius indicus TaxID=540747 RepID=A0A0T5PDT9_9RHOB|nr:cupin domain-containing protein [Roseovarius indicus]KRS19210.1 hypothetical protein XM52_06040 [Roseovarius indicus]QEW25822.1 Cupin superfamily protein [Roseovarius indicus]SFD88900.1 Cupin superfamily protein [Roseovarius indicus]
MKDFNKPTLADLLGDMTADTFRTNYNNARTVHLPGAMSDQRHHLDFSELRALVENLDNAAEYWLDEAGVERSVSLDGKTAWQRAQEGCTLICNGLSRVSEPARALSESMIDGLDGEGWPGARLFYSTAFDYGYASHLDPFATFTVQVSGRKRWFASPTPERFDVQKLSHSVIMPAPGEIEEMPFFTFRHREETDMQSFDLMPGDVLYFPAGTWHRAVSLEPSLSVAIDIRPRILPEPEFEATVIRHPPPD